MRLLRLPIGIALCLLALAPQARAQVQPPDAGPPIPGAESQSPAGKRPEGFEAGPFFLKPYFVIDQVGFDTNVFYTPTDRQSDFFASGGPGLKITAPVKRVRFTLDGDLIYYYFAKTEEQRELGGNAAARVEYLGNMVRAGVERSYHLTWGRPNLQVDERVLREQWATRAYLEFGKQEGGRLRVAPIFNLTRTEFPDQPEYQGNDLNKNLARDTYRFGVGLSYDLTGKTSLLAGAEQQLDRFLQTPSRDADSNRFVIGFRIDSPTRLGGDAVGGVRLYRPKSPAGGPDLQRPYWNIDLRYAFGPKTRMNFGFRQDLQYSALTAASTTQVMETRDYGARLQRDITEKIDLRLFGRFRQIIGDGAVIVEGPDGRPEVTFRDDDDLAYGADLGYTWKRLRVGLTAGYQERNTRTSDLGIDGLLLGASIVYNP